MQTEGEKESQDKVQEEEFSNEREKKSFFPSSKGFFFFSCLKSGFNPPHLSLHKCLQSLVCLEESFSMLIYIGTPISFVPLHDSFSNENRQGQSLS